MEMRTEQLAGAVTKVLLIGRLDISGVREIEPPFSALVSQPNAIVVDLSAVNFIASTGLRTLVLGARSVASKGGRMVLLSPTANVAKVLVDSGASQILPIHTDLDQAIAAVGGQA
jgi:anti-sigma B factor antagonist